MLKLPGHQFTSVPERNEVLDDVLPNIRLEGIRDRNNSCTKYLPKQITPAGFCPK